MNTNKDWKLVPEYPTQPMRDAGNDALDMLQHEPGMDIGDRAFYAYVAMIAAAPGSPASTVATEGGQQDVPGEVLAALDRMCTPLDPSWLKGVTAEADAKCMQTIRDYILHRPAPAAGDALARLHSFLDAAAGEGAIFAGVDADQLYMQLFPERYAAAIAQQSQRKEA